MFKQVIVVRKDLKLGRGKLSAQVAHASLQAYKKAVPEAVSEWEGSGGKKVVVSVGSRKELLDIFQKAKGLPRALITDAGLTQVKSGEITAVGIGPAPEAAVDKVTGKLKLL